IILFSNTTSTTEIYTLSLHDALPIWKAVDTELLEAQPLATLGHIQRIAADIVVYPPELDVGEGVSPVGRARQHDLIPGDVARDRSEEHTSELQSQSNLVCRLLLEKKK